DAPVRFRLAAGGQRFNELVAGLDRRRVGDVACHSRAFLQETGCLWNGRHNRTVLAGRKVPSIWDGRRISPVPQCRLDDGQRRDGGRIRPENRRTERQGRDEGPRAQDLAFLGGEPALRADENGKGGGLQRRQDRQRITAAVAFVAEEDAPLPL